MKKKWIISLVIVSLFIITGCKKKEFYITDNEILYDTAVQYIMDHDDNLEKNNNRYQLFVDYNGFGITEDNQYRYAYLWIAKESFYVVDNKIIIGPGSSMPYKFTFELVNNKVVKYEIPEDGNKYTKSIQNMYPDDIEDKAIHFTWKEDKLIEKVKNYYSDIEDKNFYYNTGEEFIKLEDNNK